MGVGSCSGSLGEDLLGTWQLFVLEAGKVVASYWACKVLLRSSVTAKGDFVVMLR
jgi:hypothetical protein